MDDQQFLTFIPLGMLKHGDLQFHEFSILTDSCRQPRSEDNSSSSCCTLQENIPLLLPPSDSDENISTTLCLFDPSWIENNRSLVESSARNYAASGERTRFLNEVENLEQRKRAAKEFLISILKNNPASANASLQIYSASKNKRKRSTQEIEEGVKQTEVMARDSSIKRYTQKDEEEEKKLRLSENLVLDQDPFKITKTLTRSDLNDLCRLLIGEKSINNHVFPAWSVEDINKAKSKVGLKVDVWDQNTNSSHTLVLKHWINWNAYVFINRWRPDFVVRRGLNVGDKIGLYWDQNNKRFTFNVLQRAAAA